VIIATRTEIAPNTTLTIGGARVVLNEQLPVAGADQGKIVNAIHIVVGGVINDVIGSAQSDIHNC
jgi:hypothetical protein